MRSTGDMFEERACAVLLRAGLTLLTRNFNTRHGELDLVMLDRQAVVFVEVRYRKSQRCGSALDSVTIGKQRKLIRAARIWLLAHPKHAHRSCRFDVISYDGSAEQLRMAWLRDAFTTDPY
jgi:putative endonuclease